MRLIDRLLGRENGAVMNADVPSVRNDASLPRKSRFGGPPTRILISEADVRKDDALLEMSQVVAEIEKHPDTNWQRYKNDFEKAVTAMRDAFERNGSHEQEVAVADKQDDSLLRELNESVLKLSERDHHAVKTYAKDCAVHGRGATVPGAKEWVKEWRSLDEEARGEQVDAQKRYNREYGVDR